MTIAISIKVGEGLVLAADSTTTVGGEKGVLNTYNFARKLTHLKDYPIGILHWGIGFVGARNIQSLISQYENDLLPSKSENSGYTVEKIAKEIFGFVREKYEEIFTEGGEKPILGMQIAGFSDKAFFPDQFVYHLPKDNDVEMIRPPLPGGKPNFGANWYGMTDAIVRLFLGFDGNTKDFMLKKGIPKKEVNDFFRTLEYPVIFDGMPLQDAIDLVLWLTNIVIGRFRFVVGVPLCGGDIDIGIITPQEFTWVKRKSWTVF